MANLSERSDGNDSQCNDVSGNALQDEACIFPRCSSEAASPYVASKSSLDLVDKASPDDAGIPEVLSEEASLASKIRPGHYKCDAQMKWQSKEEEASINLDRERPLVTAAQDALERHHQLRQDPLSSYQLSTSAYPRPAAIEGSFPLYPHPWH